jgi:predicted amidohydrolase
MKVACVQQKVKIFPNDDAFRAEISRFMQQAKAKGCGLVVFPEGVGAMLAAQYLAAPLVRVLMAAYNEDDAHGLLSVGQRLLGKLVDTASSVQDLPGIFKQTLDKHGLSMRRSYLHIFAAEARAHNMYVVAGSSYLPDEVTGRIVNASYLFGPDGETIGYQNKIHLYVEDRHLCSPGEEIKVFATDFGKLGITICYEGMFPEVGRFMAFQGAEALINVSACPGERCFAKIRAGAWSRVQDNQVFGLHSCLVGKNDLSLKFKEPYCGRSSILAPIDLTPDLSGVLAEASNLDKEEIVVAEWDFATLRAVAAASDTRVWEEFDWEVVQRYLPLYS